MTSAESTRAGLPVYRLKPPSFPFDGGTAIASRFKLTERQEYPWAYRFSSLAASQTVLDVDRRVNALWLADRLALWNPELTPALLASDAATEKAARLIDSLELVPRSGHGMTIARRPARV